MIALILAFKRRTGVDIIAENFGFMGKALVSVTASGGITYILSVLIRPDINSKFSQVAALILPMAAGLGVFWLIMGRLKVPEIKYVNELFLSRIKKVVQYIT